MKTSSQALLEDLIERTRKNINTAEKFKHVSLEDLNKKTDKESWSVLDLYGDFYLPEIKAKMSKSNTQPKEIFKSTWLGNYFAVSLLPKEKLNKMKTFKDKNPMGSTLDYSTIDKFIGQQKESLDLLGLARKVDMNKVKTAISISKLIKLRLGDTFRVLIYHNDRHMVQAQKTLKIAKR